jgi:tRNA(Ile)-lysidine synthase
MALAYLCSQVRRADPWIKVADHEVDHFRGMVVDHQMRPGSREEAEKVVTVLREKLGLDADVFRMKWTHENILPPGGDPNSLPNVESVARRLRYRLLGRQARERCIASILLAHHEDDQAETAFMRLLNGHGARGLRGMRSATDIPECGDLHGVYRSGLMDEVTKSAPFYRVGVTKRERKWLKHDLRAALDLDEMRRELRDGYDFDMHSHPFMTEEVEQQPKRSKRTLPLEPMEVEDGGVQIYRPLLGFSKERLIATCVENKVPWFEDATNKDPTLTMRNTVRHMFRGYELPVALQKPSILQLAKRCQERVAAEEAEAERLMSRIVISNQAFEPNVGTLVVQLPDFKLPTAPFRSRHSALRREKRRDHYIHIASILVQKLLSFVSPEEHLTPLPDLASVAARLFPSLADPNQPWIPKAFTVCGVILTPLPGEPFRWYLARAPYDTKLPKPELKVRKVRPSRRWRDRPSRWGFTLWTHFGLYDNRWWVSLRCRVPFEFTVAPLEAEYMKDFKQLLSDKGRADLAAALKTYAPGKVRYTLPAVYVRGNIMPLVRTEMGLDEGGDEALNWEEDTEVPEGMTTGQFQDMRSRNENKLGMPDLIRNDRCTRLQMAQLRDQKLRLVAIPTLGVSIPGVENWIDWRFRYRRVDLDALMKSMTPEEYSTRERLRRQKKQRLEGPTCACGHNH